MTSKVYNPKIHHKKLLTVLIFIAIIAMFLIRGILYQTGTLERMQTLDPEEIRERIAQYEVQVTFTKNKTSGALGTDASGAESYRYGGTILDGRKESAGEDNYTLTIATALPDGTDWAGTDEEGQNGEGAEALDAASSDETGADGNVPYSQEIKVTLPDGSEVSGSILYTDASSHLALIQCECPTETDVYYSRDILERLAAGDTVYSLRDGVLAEGNVTQVKAAVSGVGTDLTAVDMGAAEEVPGTGFYGTSGNYLGMILQNTEDGNTICVSAVDIIKVLNQEL